MNADQPTVEHQRPGQPPVHAASDDGAKPAPPTASRKEISPAPLIMVVLTGLLIWAVTHAALTRTVEDYLHHGVYVVAPLAAVMAIAGFLQWRDANFARPTFVGISAGVGILVMLVVVAVVLYSLGASLSDLVLWVQTPSDSKAPK